MRQALVWIRDHKLSSAGLVLVILGCVALVNLSRRVHHLKPRTAAVARASAASTPAVLASRGGTSPGASEQARVEPGARSARMRAEFEAAASDLDFIRQATGRPQEGGLFYALLAWKRCNDVNTPAAAAAPAAGNDAFHDAAMARVADIRKACTGVLEAYADAQALYRVAVEQPGGRDLLLPPEGRGIVAPAARATANADIDAALQTGDPWAAAQALRANAGFLDVGNSTGDDGVDRQLHEWAAEIVACELVGSCRGGVEASLHCVRTGDCAHDDYRDVVLAQVPDSRRIIFDTVLAAVRERMGQPSGRNYITS